MREREGKVLFGEREPWYNFTVVGQPILIDFKENDTMPHIDIKLFPGRSDEMKKAAAAKIVEAAAAELKAPPSVFSVSFTEVEKDAWNETVADKIEEADLFAGEVYRV